MKRYKVFVVGTGPGNYDQMTEDAVKILDHSDVIIGYTTYVDLVREYFPGKEFITTPMRRERERCVMAFEKAREGQVVSLVCSGDPGIYGMAGLMYEVGEEYPDVEVVVMPGVTAASAGAALLGAPLGHDFCVISLSDLLTPWETIEKRLAMAAQGDFVICLYNPGSKKRKDYLLRACDIILHYQSPETVCAVASSIGRPEEESRIMTLRELRDTPVDMFTTVYVGNSTTRVIGGAMVTPRGYENKENGQS